MFLCLIISLDQTGMSGRELTHSLVLKLLHSFITPHQLSATFITVNLFKFFRESRRVFTCALQIVCQHLLLSYPHLAVLK